MKKNDIIPLRFTINKVSSMICFMMLDSSSYVPRGLEGRYGEVLADPPPH